MTKQPPERFANWPRGLPGFVACAIFTAVVTSWFYLTAGVFAERLVDLGVDASGVLEERRWGAAYLGQIMLIGFCIYWGIAALFGKGQLERLLLPNILLAAAITTWLVTVTVHFYGWTDSYCDQLPYSHEGFDITRILECPSNAIFFGWLALIAPILCVASLVLRILLSRRKDAAVS
jgi:hypothetical protein